MNELTRILPREQLSAVRQAIENFDSMWGATALLVLAEILGIRFETDQ